MHAKTKLKLLLLLLFVVLGQQVWAQEAVNKDVNEVIRKHGLEQSQVMDIASWLTDVYGPRLTGSPMLDKATNWAVEKLKTMGMKNVTLHEWGPFGRGWEFSAFSMQAIAPNSFPIIAYPKAWSPSTNGLVSGEVVYLDIENDEDYAKYKGKLAGKFVMIEDVRAVEEWFKPMAERRDSDGLLNMANAPNPNLQQQSFNRSNLARRGGDMRMEFLYEEKPLAIIDRSSKGDLGTVFVSGARVPNGRAQDPDATVIPQVTMAVEHYNRIMRMLEKGIAVNLNMNLEASYSNPDGMEHNILAEIPGTDLKDEIVMLGAHFDSWHSGTGATDNGAGSSVMMEAARILLETFKETGIKPRRTIRLALWTGEEQGLFGSRAYVADRVATMEATGGFRGGPIKELLEEHSKISAYYNLDNGTGKIRGVYMQGNEAVRPIFQAWLQPFKDLDASTLTLSNTGGTDHLAFDAVGVPGFQFIQEPMAYSTRTHHSNMDNWDHLVADDLKQAATIIASFVFHTAQRDEQIPRKEIQMSGTSGTN